MATSLATILNWFKINAIPTEAQFKATFTSFRHKLNKVPVGDIEGIDELIAQKADNDKLNSHIEDDSRHISAEFIETLQSKVTVFGNWFQLIKHPSNDDVLKANAIEVGDIIMNGFRDNQTFWKCAVCRFTIDVDLDESWTVLDSIDEMEINSSDSSESLQDTEGEFF